MLIGIIIPIKDRFELVSQCFESIKKSVLIHNNIFFVLINDGSSDKRIKDLINNTAFGLCKVIRLKNKKPIGISNSLLIGFETAIINGANFLLNLDSDTIVKPNWLLEIISVYSNIKNLFGAVLTGFNTLTKDENTDRIRHPIKKEFNSYFEKESIGGINMFFNLETYNFYIKPNLKLQGHWDWNVCKSGAKFYCTKPSVIQHIGIMQGTNLDNPDIAYDF